MAVIGIDLGTTNSLAAYWKDGRAELIRDENGAVLLPSVVGYVENEGFVVGEADLEMLYGYCEGVYTGRQNLYAHGAFRHGAGTDQEERGLLPAGRD